MTVAEQWAVWDAWSALPAVMARPGRAGDMLRVLKSLYWPGVPVFPMFVPAWVPWI